MEICDLNIQTIAKDEFEAMTRDLAGGWIIVQTFEKIRFDAWSGGAVPELDASIAGRIFTAAAELRWVRDGDAWEAWRIEESPGSAYVRHERKYFLWGTWKDDEFAELRIPAKLAYPVAARGELERPFILVAEYSKNKPPSWPSKPKDIEALLNAPAIAAHRFKGVGAAAPEKDTK
jgi:hypothetical protein